jgi:hypothetical protein
VLFSCCWHSHFHQQALRYATTIFHTTTKCASSCCPYFWRFSVAAGLLLLCRFGDISTRTQHASQIDVRFAFAVSLLCPCASSLSSHRHPRPPPPVWVALNHIHEIIRKHTNLCPSFSLLRNHVQGHFWAQSVETLVFPSPTGYMFRDHLSKFLCLIGVYYSIHSCKVTGNLPEALNLNQLFLKLSGFIRN